MTVDISCIVTLHHEGILAHKTLASIGRAMYFAAANGARTELLLVADRADGETLQYLQRSPHLPPDTRILSTDFGDPGLARNHGARQARGEYIAILDGDDLCSENWLASALRQARENPAYIVHPDYNVYFGAERWILRHPDQRDTGFRASQLLVENAWTALCVVRRETLLTIPYRDTPADSGFGYEDWHWNCDTIAAGLMHVVAADTAHFIRLKVSGSRNAAATERSRLIRHSPLFDHAQLLGLEGKSVQATDTLAAGAVDADWDEEAYLRVHPDVRDAVRARSMKSGKDHWRLFGRAEGRLLPTPAQRATVKAWSEEAYLDANEDVRASVAQGRIASGLHHWLRFGDREGRDLKAPEVPAWIRNEMHALAAYELQLFPSRQFFKDARRRTFRASVAVGNAYRDMLEVVGPRPVTHVFMLPWLKRGGADLVALHHIHALVRDFSAQILVITTENTESPWMSRLPAEVRVLPFGITHAPHLQPIEQRLLLSRLLLKLRPGVVHNINSATAWDLYVRHGNALSEDSGLYASLFGFDYTEELEPYGYGGALEASYRYLTKVMTDNQAFVGRLISMYGLPPDLFERFRYPQHSRPRFEFDARQKPRILWAGRFDREKRPDLLLQIAQRLPECHFDVYGSPTLSTPPEILAVLAALRRMRNVSVLGAYEGFDSVPAENYALLLYTTQWDGLPNVVLEAQASGLPVLAPDIGGISEAIPAGSGFLLERFDDVEGYVARIRQFLTAPAMLLHERARALSLIEANHSQEAFREHLARLPSYSGS
ncbi:glycosyltransferase [Cupriavidus alkaliphilus]|uniref:Glycosyltransferase involved in cell wall biosynthesis n=1 Tax=Cupriavidus alkaliphilus TaxID=942866 RepID=A0A7W4V681_9BURK|nr:glycosyltransferase [Cupriavidus alkaliphilus]MBB3005778.1 glycosyltransferase involved in cell wall biosynthesis [Cupriavidus alkaliphilus]